jgi:hypothetical protein
MACSHPPHGELLYYPPPVSCPLQLFNFIYHLDDTNTTPIMVKQIPEATGTGLPKHFFYQIKQVAARIKLLPERVRLTI